MGKEIVELEMSGFKTDETTVMAANLGLKYLKNKKEKANEQSNSEVDPKKKYTVGVDYPFILQVS